MNSFQQAVGVDRVAVPIARSVGGSRCSWRRSSRLVRDDFKRLFGPLAGGNGRRPRSSRGGAAATCRTSSCGPRPASLSPAPRSCHRARPHRSGDSWTRQGEAASRPRSLPSLGAAVGRLLHGGVLRTGPPVLVAAEHSLATRAAPGLGAHDVLLASRFDAALGIPRPAIFARSAPSATGMAVIATFGTSTAAAYSGKSAVPYRI